MKKLRHPISSIREPFGTAGLIVAMIALVAALGGTAFAAAKLNSTQKKEVAKIAKKEAQKYANSNPGAPGANGTNGKDGANGTNGAPGSPGTDGEDGKSVALGVATSTHVGGECPDVGGTTVEVEGTPASKKKVCNGKEGSPWTAGGTLPTGSTETGSWGYFTHTEGNIFEPISFPIPLPTVVEGAHLLFVTGAEQAAETVPAECTVGGVEGSVENPLAEEGNLCVYERQGFFTAALIELAFPTKAGVIAAFQGPGTVNQSSGTWAVTAG